MNKLYQKPDIELIALTLRDVILASGDGENIGSQTDPFNPNPGELNDELE